MARWGQIVSRDGLSYQLTDADLLWAARMIVGESPSDAKLLLWAMAQRFALSESRPFRTFRELLQSYSQPISRRWLSTGVCCAPGATGCPARPSRSFYGEPQCDPGVIARRERIRSMRWSQIPASVRSVVVRWARAQVSNPVPRATDFAAPAQLRGFLRRERGSFLVRRAHNWFAGVAESAEWPSDQVVLKHNGRVAGVSGIGVLLLLGALVGGGYWYARRRGLLSAPAASETDLARFPRRSPRRS